MHRNLLLALLFVLFANLAAAVEPPPGAVPGGLPGAGRPPAVVSVTVDFADGFQRSYPTVAWTEGLTALDALKTAARRPRGGFEIVERGSGETAFVRSIDGVTNEGGGGRNWKYQVNSKHADRSAGIYKLQAGDAVLWKFEGGR